MANQFSGDAGFEWNQKPVDPNRPYPEGLAWDEAYRQRKRADALESLAKSQVGSELKVVEEFPGLPGYYWYKNEFNGGWQVVEAWRNDQGYWMIGMQLADENYIENFITDETVWYGPIPQPIEND